MKGNKYDHIDEPTALGFLVSAMEGGGDRGQSFPRSDAKDLSRGLRFIPGEVTLARRKGERVEFTQRCQNQCCWYWSFQDGSCTYYWERASWEKIAALNSVELKANKYGTKVGNAGPCPLCGNPHTDGGHVAREEI